MPTLTLIRGISGSGKSTLAKELTELGGIHLEADMFFVNNNEKYVFEVEKLSDAHAWCQRQTLHHLKQNRDVVVANVFAARWEVMPYHTIAKLADARIRVITCQNNYGNIHFVPTEVLERQQQNWEHYVGEKQMEY